MGIIEIRNVTKTYRTGFWGKKRLALKDLSLEIEDGEAFGFLGPNGAGKTTTLKILLGIVQPDSGSATILGKPIKDVSTKSRIGFLPEQPYFYDYLTGKELLEFYAGFFGLSRSERRKRIACLLEAVSLIGSEGIALKKYSKGMLQRIGIAQALINDPDVIFLDEPLSGLDPLGRKEIRDIVLRLKDEGKTIFFCSHFLPDVEMICDRVAILNKGILVAVNNLNELLLEDSEMADIIFKGVSEEGIEEIRRVAIKWLEHENRFQVTLCGEENIMSAIRLIDRYGGRVISVVPQRRGLEELFVKQMQGTKERSDEMACCGI
ncbi:ABC transporter ATP-binding protein [bacterium]|nr:ABC transporter ATP-binding protein [bacterium]